MANESNLSYINNGWWSCGCGGKPKEQAILPAKTKAIFMKSHEKMYGPITGIEYDFQPHQNSIDVDEKDADYWVNAGQARPMLVGYKGRLTRTGRTNGSTE